MNLLSRGSFYLYHQHPLAAGRRNNMTLNMKHTNVKFSMFFMYWGLASQIAFENNKTRTTQIFCVSFYFFCGKLIYILSQKKEKTQSIYYYGENDIKGKHKKKSLLVKTVLFAVFSSFSLFKYYQHRTLIILFFKLILYRMQNIINILQNVDLTIKFSLGSPTDMENIPDHVIQRCKTVFSTI